MIELSECLTFLTVDDMKFMAADAMIGQNAESCHGCYFFDNERCMLANIAVRNAQRLHLYTCVGVLRSDKRGVIWLRIQ